MATADAYTNNPSIPRPTQPKPKPNVYTQPPVNPWQGAIDQFQDITSVGGGGGLGGADKTAALADIDLERRKLAFQETTGMRDIGQARESGLQRAINNALQRGIYRSGIRVDNENLVNRESDEAGSDLKQQIAFALEALKNRETAVKAGGGGGGGSGGVNLSDLLQIYSRFMGAGGEFGWYTAPPDPSGSGQFGNPGFGTRFGQGTRF